MPIGMKRLVWKPVVVHNLSADKCLQWQCCEHVQPKEESCNVHHQIVFRKVVQHVAHRLVPECEISREGHDQARKQRDACTVVCDARKSVDGGLSQGAVDEETVMMANECERYDADGLEDARMDDQRAAQLASGFGWDAERLRDDGHDDN